MYYFNNPYHEVTFFNLNQINTLAGQNPIESKSLLSGFWEKNETACYFANPPVDISILTYPTS
jgi:hypothetical protein